MVRDLGRQLPLDIGQVGARLPAYEQLSAQMSMPAVAMTPSAADPGSGDTRLMLRAAQLYYHGDLTQDAIGKRLGVSRFKVGRLLDRALREQAVRIEIVHPAARLVAMEDALAERFGLADAIVIDVPATGSAGEDEQLARERVAAAAAEHLAHHRAARRHRRLLGPDHDRAGRSPPSRLDARRHRSCSSTAPSRARPSPPATRRSWSASAAPPARPSS